MDEKLRSENMRKRAVLKAIRAGRCRERRYADNIFIQIYFRMHHFVVKFYSRMPLQTTHRTAFDLHYWRLNDYCEHCMHY